MLPVCEGLVGNLASHRKPPQDQIHMSRWSAMVTIAHPLASEPPERVLVSETLRDTSAKYK
eukprot:2296004-Amphidinium_carterae.1